MDKSCNMIINYSRISEIEDPVERINKELNQSQVKTNESQGTFSILKQGIMSIGSFGLDSSPTKAESSSNKPSSKNTASSKEAEREEESKKNKTKSNGIFDTLFRSLEPKPEEPKKSKANEPSAKPPSGRSKESDSKQKPKQSDSLKAQDRVEENAEDFFGGNSGTGDRSGRSTIAVSSPAAFSISGPAAFSMSNLSSLDIINYYKDKPKDLMKLFHQIGTKMMNGKDNRGPKWIADIIKTHVSLLLFAASTVEEIQRLDKIKHYFALKIEKIMEEKKDSMKNIEALQEEIKYEQRKKEEVREEERKARIKLMEKTTEFTVRMNELLNIKEERDQALKSAETSEKKLKETKKVTLGDEKAFNVSFRCHLKN